MKALQTARSFLTERWPLNVPALIACLALSVFIHFVYYSQETGDETFTVPLTVMADSGFVPAAPYTDEVRVQVRGSPADVKSLTKDDFSAYLDLNYVNGSGSVRVPVLLRLSDKAGGKPSLQIQCKPGYVVVEVEESVTRTVPVEAVLLGLPARGYRVGSVSVSPAGVEVTGRRSRVESLGSLKTKPLRVDGATSDVSGDVEVSAGSSEVSEGTVFVNVEVVPAMGERKVEMARVNLSGVDSRLEVASHTAAVPLTVWGGVLDLEKWRVPQSLVTADCSRIHSAGRFDVPVSYALPQGFSLAGDVVRSVSVTFREKKVQPPPEAAETAEETEE